MSEHEQLFPTVRALDEPNTWIVHAESKSPTVGPVKDAIDRLRADNAAYAREAQAKVLGIDLRRP